MPAPTRIAAALVALLLAATVSPASAAVVPDRRDDVSWRDLAYVYYDSAGYYAYVPTNGELWKAHRITNTSSGLSPQPPTPELYSGKVLEALWKPSCPATKEQKVTMTRKVLLPGPLSSLHVGLKTLVTSPTMHQGKNPFAWAELRLNGSTVLRLNSRSTPLDTWKGADLASGDVRHGTNTLTVVAKKRKTKKAWGFCYSGTPDFGVAAEVYAVPRSELSASIPVGTFSGQMTATVTNAGPSYLVGGPSGGQFWWTNGEPTGSAAVVDALGQVNGGTGTCTTTHTVEGVSVTCPMPVLAPGESLKVDIYLQLSGTTCPGDWQIPFAYKVVGLWRETDLADNGQLDRRLACSPQ